MDACLREERDFKATAAYLSLRPHLDAGVLNKVETGRGLYSASAARPGDAKHQFLVDEIARVEQKWDLV
jgi:hypothetical protein